MTGRWRAAVIGGTLAGLVLPAAPAAPAALPRPPVPYVADLDGDGADDLYWAGAGAAHERLWFGDGTWFRRETVPLRDTARPVLGDFDGDGRGDVFHYAAGRGADRVWYGGADRGMSEVAVSVNGSYEPVVGDFDGDRRDDVLWYAPGKRPDTVWYGAASRRFQGRAESVDVDGRPTVGDFDGDGRTDIRWQTAGNRAETVWYATATGFETKAADKVGTGYRAVVGDYDGDGSDDVLWYPSSGRNAFADLGSRVRLPRRVPIDLPARGETAVGDFTGDGIDDVVVAAGSNSVLVHGAPAGLLRTTEVDAPSGQLPVAGDFDGDDRAEILWTGRAPDTIWRWNVVGDPLTEPVRTRPNRLPALDQGVWEAQYRPYGYIAHAMGAIDGAVYTNSLEAFHHNYAAGFRVFEVDFITLGDRSIWALHDRTEPRLGLKKHFRQTTSAEVRGRKFLGKYTVLSAHDVLALMRTHRDVTVVIDAKWDRVEIIRRLLRAAADPQVARRLVPHIEGQWDLDAVRQTYPLQHYIVALYRTQWAGKFDDAEVLEFVRRNETPAVMMWVGTRDWSMSLSANAHAARRYDPGFAADLWRAGAVRYVHSTGDPEVMRRFADTKVGVYSDGPLGPDYPVPAPAAVPPVPTPPAVEPVVGPGRPPA